jgi:predicted kinase
LSGSGKSTWLARHYPDYEVISLDDLREEINGKRSSQKQFGQIIQTAKARLKAALREHRGVVWDATNLRMELRAQILDLARDYHALITMAVFMLPLKTIWQQNNEREYCLPNSVLQRQIEQWQLPTLSEAHHYQVIGEEGKLLYESGNWSTL